MMERFCLVHRMEQCVPCAVDFAPLNRLVRGEKRPLLSRRDAFAVLTKPGAPFELDLKSMTFKNGPRSLSELFEYAASSNQPFLVEDGVCEMSFADVWLKARCVAAFLVAMRVVPGDCVAFSFRNHFEWVLCFAASHLVGAIAVPFNALWSAAELAHALDNCSPVAFFGDEERLNRLAKAPCKCVPRVVVGVRLSPGAQHSGVHRFEDVVKLNNPVSTIFRADADSTALILYTSGSTGHPKGAVSTHRNVLTAILNWDLERAMGILEFGVLTSYVQPWTILCAPPLFHVTALNVALLSSLRLQRRVLLYSKKWDADEAMRQIVKYSVGTVSAPSAITGDLLRLLEKGVSAPSLREVGGGGAPRPESQVVGLAKFVAPGIGWGMTETNAIGSSFNGPMYVARPRCTGRMSASILWKVDEKGELLVKGGAVIEKYWPDVAARSADGWLHTGDLAVVGEDDMLEIVGRAKDMILRGGENISCPAVEHALAAHEAVLEVAVYAIPENRLGELVGATVNVRRAVTVQELREHCRGLLAAFEVPEHVLIVSNTPLPRLASEKIDKKQLQRAHIQLLKSKL